MLLAYWDLFSLSLSQLKTRVSFFLFKPFSKRQVLLAGGRELVQEGELPAWSERQEGEMRRKRLVPRCSSQCTDEQECGQGLVSPACGPGASAAVKPDRCVFSRLWSKRCRPGSRRETLLREAGRADGSNSGLGVFNGPVTAPAWPPRVMVSGKRDLGSWGCPGAFEFLGLREASDVGVQP